jgi:hypothetical protein
MTFAERVHQVTTLGFLDRHARFLVTVLLHAGVCVGRQYCAFAGIRRGQVMHDFFTDLVGRGFATAYPARMAVRTSIICTRRRCIRRSANRIAAIAGRRRSRAPSNA